MIDKGHKSNEIKYMLKQVKNEISMAKPKAEMYDDKDDDEKSGRDLELTIHDELGDYSELFELFIVKRKIELLRYLFKLPTNEFSFKYDHFLKALELEAYDMSALLYKEFFREMREKS